MVPTEVALQYPRRQLFDAAETVLTRDAGVTPAPPR